MIRRLPLARVPRAVAAAVGCLVLLGCGSTSNPTSSGVVASFLPDAPSPPDGSVTLQAGETTGTLVQVRVSVKGVDDFFGAAFWISYDATNVAYRSYDVSTSLICDGGCDTDPKKEAVTVLVDPLSLPGTIKFGVSKRQLDGTIKGVNVTDASDLIVLTFVARQAVTGSPIMFVDGHGEVIDSTPPPTNTTAVTWAGGTLTAK
ncbi:MAG: hypothetical protein LAO51_16520 [Acidobacteriia bacterium]|nr:hypothetical protein [Terriglobia bacterium]